MPSLLTLHLNASFRECFFFLPQTYFAITKKDPTRKWPHTNGADMWMNDINEEMNEQMGKINA
jgi:hypothetical protein